MAAYLDKTGLSKAWAKIKNYLKGENIATSVVSGQTTVDGALDSIIDTLGLKADKSTTYTKQEVDNALAGKKSTQSAVADPSASGTSLTFISGITQNAQGVISPSKKTVSTMGAASSSAAGTAGLVPAPASGSQSKFLRGDGTWQTPADSDTKNTAGSTDSSSKLFLIGATSQAANPQTYSHDTAYVGTDGCLYSGGKKVLTDHQAHQTIKQDGVTGATANRYATCSTAAGTAAKTATITTGTFTLETGATVYVKFTNSNTVASPTLNVNSTGAKPIMRYGTTAAGTSAAASWTAGAVVPFTYDGTNWIMQSAWDNNTTYSNASLGQGYGTCTTAAATAAKIVTLSSYVLTTGGVVSVKFTNSVPASATMNINSKGAKAIFYKGAAITAGVIEAGDLATFIYDGTQYHLLSIDRLDQENRRSRRDITSDLANLSAAVTERNLTKYGYSIGDYFTGPSGYEYTLGDQDTFSGIGKYDAKSYGVIHEPHLSIVVNTKQNVQWNTTYVTDTGYVGSNLHSYLVNTVLPNVKNDFATLFGNWANHLISHSKLYRTNNNKWGWGWSTDQYISALTSVQLHGSPICDMDGTDTGEGNKPLEVFQKFFYPEILGNQNNWLRSVSADGYPCHVTDHGQTRGDVGASSSYGAVGLIIFK